MAKHLIVGDGTALAWAANGLVNDGAVSVEKMSASAGTHTLKIINLTNGNEPFEMKSYDITVANTASLAVQSAAFKVAIDLDLPHWVNGAVTDGTGAISATGFKKGETKADGSIQEDLVHMSFVFEGTDTTMAVTYSTPGLRGYGDVYYLKQFENELMGTSHGYYNRLELPNAPTNQVLITNTYDMYSLVATKDGSSSSQIHGVDNLIEINIGLKPGDADSGIVENKINQYLAGAFTFVIL